MTWSNLQLRILSGLVLAPPVLAVAYFGSPWFNIFLCVLAALLAWEWERMCGNTFGVPMVKIALWSTIAIFMMPDRPQFAGAAIALGLVSVWWSANRFNAKGDPKWSALGLLYIAVPCISLVIVRGGGIQGPETLLWLLAVVWGTDIGAYGFGRIIGGPLLAPRISPRKTWAGFFGGILSAVGLACAVGLLYEISNFVMLAGVSVGVSIISQMGDL
ncbi:MAG: hypothetical protein A2516_01980, partial [Alphaproteobacteria bacterium RIFOXYD12_FULL_60_8]